MQRCPSEGARDDVPLPGREGLPLAAVRENRFWNGALPMSHDKEGTADAFVVKRLRSKPVEYIVKIRHFVSGGKWVMGVSVHGVAEPDNVQKERVAADLRYAANLLETGEWSAESE